jgi:hypothetical protein
MGRIICRVTAAVALCGQIGDYGDSALNLTGLADFDVRSIRQRLPPAALAGTV